jgi:hypothetical protein
MDAGWRREGMAVQSELAKCLHYLLHFSEQELQGHCTERGPPIWYSHFLAMLPASESIARIEEN